MKGQIILLLAVFAGFVSSFRLSSQQISLNSSIVASDIKNGRITNGADAIEGQIPYQVAISLREGSSRRWCSGSILSPTWILTVAHCTVNAQTIDIYFGANVLSQPEYVFVVGEESVIIHELWNPRLNMNDISLIKTPRIRYSKNVKPAKLPEFANSYPTYAGDEAVISGWGATSDTSASISDRLQWGNVKIITNSECAELYAFRINPSKICIGTPELISPCYGDSGAPLVLRSSGIQVGLVSFGTSECEGGDPIVLTRITNYTDWIIKNTGGLE